MTDLKILFYGSKSTFKTCVSITGQKEPVTKQSSESKMTRTKRQTWPRRINRIICESQRKITMTVNSVTTWTTCGMTTWTTRWHFCTVLYDWRLKPKNRNYKKIKNKRVWFHVLVHEGTCTYWHKRKNTSRQHARLSTLFFFTYFDTKLK